MFVLIGIGFGVGGTDTRDEGTTEVTLYGDPDTRVSYGISGTNVIELPLNADISATVISIYYDGVLKNKII